MSFSLNSLLQGNAVMLLDTSNLIWFGSDWNMDCLAMRVGGLRIRPTLLLYL